MMPGWLRSVRRRPRPAPHAPTVRHTPAAHLTALSLEDRIAPATSIFQEGVDVGFGAYVGTKDTYVRRDGTNATTSRATAATVFVDAPDLGEPNVSNTTQGLLRFNTIVGTNPGQIPPNARIVRAYLTVMTTNPGDGGEFHRMLVDWADTITWNTATANGTRASRPTAPRR
jgi:hypothetical protein